MWGCDCDGTSHNRPTDHSPADSGIKRHAMVIERVTGTAPRTCPWRSFYDPLVIEVMNTIPQLEKGIGLVDDPPAILVEAIGVYQLALNATRNEEQRLHLDRIKKQQAADNTKR